MTDAHPGPKNRHPLYKKWNGMKARCISKAKGFENYQRYGVRVCERWRDFWSFVSDMGLPPTASHTIDRIDNTKGYSLDNCRWATQKEQHRNKTTNVLLTAFGETKPIASWIDDPRCKAPPAGLYARIRAGHDHHIAITEPKLRSKSCRYTCDEIAQMNGMHQSGIGFSEIAIHFKCTNWTARRLILGLDRRGRKLP